MTTNFLLLARLGVRIPAKTSAARHFAPVYPKWGPANAASAGFPNFFVRSPRPSRMDGRSRYRLIRALRIASALSLRFL